MESKPPPVAVGGPHVAPSPLPPPSPAAESKPPPVAVGRPQVASPLPPPPPPQPLPPAAAAKLQANAPPQQVIPVQPVPPASPSPLRAAQITPPADERPEFKIELDKTPKLSTSDPERKQPISTANVARSKASPAVEINEKQLIRRLRKSDKTPRKPVQKRVEFVPSIEYLDVSRIAIRFLQSLMLIQMLLHLYEIPTVLHEAQAFFSYQKVLSYNILFGSMVAPAAIGFAALIAFRTIYGIFAINFTRPSSLHRTIHRLVALVMAHVIFGLIIVAAAEIFNAELRSEAVQEVVKRNMAHLIRYSTKDTSYMEEINRLQQELQCCGMQTDVQLDNGTYTDADHPWNMWFAAYSLDDTYPNVIRELYSLPWSCCNLTKSSKCEHIGVSRYLRTFATPSDFYDVEAALGVKKLNWNPTTFEHYLDRNELAIATIYDRDCAKELLQLVATQADAIKAQMQRSGITMLMFSLPLVLVTFHLQVVIRSNEMTMKPTVTPEEEKPKAETVEATAMAGKKG